MAAAASLEDQYIKREMVLIALSNLTPREQEVVWSRANGEVLKSIGKRQGVCSQRIREIEARAYRKALYQLRRRGYAPPLPAWEPPVEKSPAPHLSPGEWSHENKQHEEVPLAFIATHTWPKTDAGHSFDPRTGYWVMSDEEYQSYMAKRS